MNTISNILAETKKFTVPGNHKEEVMRVRHFMIRKMLCIPSVYETRLTEMKNISKSVTKVSVGAENHPTSDEKSEFKQYVRAISFKDFGHLIKLRKLKFQLLAEFNDESKGNTRLNLAC